MQRAFFRSVIYAVCFVMLCSCRHHTVDTGSEIVVTNTYLQAVVLDLDPTLKQVDTLAGPGMCPGHFDMTAGVVNQLRKAKLLLRFDFQAGLDDQLERLRRNGLSIQPIQAAKGLSIPASYISICRQAAEVLGEKFPDHREDYRRQLEQIRQRQIKLETSVHDRLAPKISNGQVCVVSSGHQAAFARWMGLNVVGTFSGSDQTSPSEIDNCLKAGSQKKIRIVIANRQEGTALAQLLSERLGAKVVIFSNFPEQSRDHCWEPGFDALVEQNVQALLEALK